MTAVAGEKAMEERKVRFTAVDLSVVLLVIAIAVLAVIRTGAVGKILFRGEDCDVVFTASSLASGFSDNISNGDEVRLPDGTLIGTVVAVTSSASSFYPAGSGDKVSYPANTFEDVKITVRCSLAWKDGYWVSSAGTRVVPGESHSLSTLRAVFDATVTSVIQSSGN